MPDPGQRRHRGLAVGVHDGIADRIQFAFSWRLGGVCALLALLHRGRLGRLLARLPGDEGAEAADIERECLEIGRRQVVRGRVARGLSPMKGTLAAANFSAETNVGDEDAGVDAAVLAAGAGVAAAASAGGGEATEAADDAEGGLALLPGR